MAYVKLFIRGIYNTYNKIMILQLDLVNKKRIIDRHRKACLSEIRYIIQGLKNN